MTRLSLAVLALLLAAPAWAAGLRIETGKIEKETDAYTISVEYPKTGNATIDAEIGAWAQKEYDDFVKLSTEDRQPDQNAYDLEVTFDVGRNDAGGFGVLFTEYTDTGGAHPNSDFTTFNYVMPDAWRVYLPEIFDGPKALKRISALAVADLKKQLAGPDGGSDEETIQDGAGPAWDNFADLSS